MLTSLFSRIIILFCAILHPAYKSYKSLRSKNQLEIVTWIMYWIVFAMYTAVETVTDVVLCWLPFYYEMKIIFILWMTLPVTRGYSVIFRKIIHPRLQKHEPEIDEIIDRATEKGYNALLNFGAKGINFAATTVLSTAVRGQEFLYTRSLSMGDLSFQHRNSLDNVPSNSQIDATVDDFDNVISGHGDYSTNTLPKIRSKKRGYDTGTFPRRRPRTLDSDLHILPEEETSMSIEIDPETKKEQYNISKEFRYATSPKEAPKRLNLSSYMRSHSDASDQTIYRKPPIYRPSVE